MGAVEPSRLLLSSGLSTWGDDNGFILPWPKILRLVSTAIFQILSVEYPPYSGEWPRDGGMAELLIRRRVVGPLTSCERSGGEYLGGVA